MQSTLVSTPVKLYKINQNATEEKGDCLCAIVGITSSPPRFNIVCYTEQRSVLVCAAITSNIEQSLKFQIQVDNYATFIGNDGSIWGILFLKTGDINLFCANMGIACFGAANKPNHSIIICDLAHINQRSSIVKLGDRIKTKYVAFSYESGKPMDVPKIIKLTETNGDIPYNFESVQSPYSISIDGKGFESSMANACENSYRIIVVPSTVPRNGKSVYSNTDMVYVVFISKIYNEIVRTKYLEDKTEHVETSMITNPIPSNTHADPLVSGSGIPLSQMSQIQKSVATINTIITQVRDLDDKIICFKEEWNQMVNKPKPSLLTSNALEHQVKHMILENERVKEEIRRRDELISAVDERNRDLQKRVDKAAEIAQSLLDEKKQTVSSTADLKLEQDRQIMKLQDQISKSRMERDDVERHLQTVKKMFEMTDSELISTKSQVETIHIELKGLKHKEEALEDQLNEERIHRKSLELKANSLQDEVRHIIGELHVKTSQLRASEQKVETERLHHLQLLEDEQQRRAVETQQIRSEIVTELQSKEDRFNADKALVSEAHFSRGKMDGQEVGRTNAQADVDLKLKDLKLSAQRARNELESYKVDLANAQDESIKSNQTAEATILELKGGAESASRQRAHLEYQLEVKRSKAKCIKDSFYTHFANFIHRTKYPIPPNKLANLLESVHEETEPDFTYQLELVEVELQKRFENRLSWITEELLLQYNNKALNTYHTLYLNVLEEAHKRLNDTILNLNRGVNDLGDLITQEQSIQDQLVGEEAALIENTHLLVDNQINGLMETIRDEEFLRKMIIEEAIALFQDINNKLQQK